MKIDSVFFILCSISMLFYECKEGDKLSEIDEGKKREKRHVPRENPHHRVMTNMEEILSHKWSQVIEGKEFADILPLLKTDKELSCVLSAQKKEDKSYDISVHYYDGTLHLNTIRGIYYIDRKGELIAEDNSPELVIKKEDDHHITFKLNGNIVSFQGKAIHFFKTPGSIDDLYGIWRTRSFIDGGERGDFISADLASWNIPKRNSVSYLTDTNYEIRDNAYFLKIFKEPRTNFVDDGSDYGRLFTGGLNTAGFTSNQKPSLSSTKNSFVVRNFLNDLKRIYILDYDSSKKTITTLIWWPYKYLYIDIYKSSLLPHRVIVSAPDEYTNRFLKVTWKKNS